MIGFHFRETMAGTCRGDDGVERKMHFTIVARAQSVLQHVRDRKAAIEGHVHVEGIAEEAPLAGELTIDPVLGRKIRYEFDFTGDDGQRYRFEGQKDVSFADLLRTMTTLPGELRDAAGKLVARAELLFDKRHLPKFLASFRPRF